MSAQHTINGIEDELESLRRELLKKDDEIQLLRGKLDNRKKLSAVEVRQIRTAWKSRLYTQAELGDEYEVNPSTISRTVRGIYHG